MNSRACRPIIRMELLRHEDESVYDSISKYPLEGSSLTITNQNGCRRSVSLVLDNSDGRFNPNPNGGLWINTRFKLSLGIEDENKNTIFFPQGIFCLSDSEPELVSDPEEGYIANIKADDKWSLFQRTIGSLYQIPKGYSVETSIRELLKECGDTKSPVLQNLSDNNTYVMRWGMSDTYDTLFKDLGNLYSRDVFYDQGGHLVYQEFTDISTLETIWNFNKSEVQYMGSTRVQQYDKVTNDVVVFSSNTNGLTYRAEAKDTDPTSNTRIGYIDTKSTAIQNDKLQSNDDCQLLANYQLEKGKRVQECLSLKSMCLPHFDINKAFTITDENIGLRNRVRYAIQAIQMPLDFKTEMNITAYRFNDTDDFQDRTTESGNSDTTPESQ